MVQHVIYANNYKLVKHWSIVLQKDETFGKII